MNLEEKIKKHLFPNRVPTREEWAMIRLIPNKFRFRQGDIIGDKYFIKYGFSYLNGLRCLTKEKYDIYLNQCVKYRRDNLDTRKAYLKNRYNKNLEAERLKRKKYREENKEKIIKYRSRPEFKERVNNWSKNRRKTNPNYKIGQRLRNRLKELVKCSSIEIKHSNKTEKESALFLVWLYEKQKIDSTKKYHIDHIMPCHIFDLSDISQSTFCNSPYNVRWITAQHNLKKGSKLPSEHEIVLHRHLVEEWQLNYPLTQRSFQEIRDENVIHHHGDQNYMSPY
jgi:hypothetical protein